VRCTAGANVSGSWTPRTSGGDGLTDRDKAEQQAASVGGEERHFLYGYCAARAHRIVREQAPLIVALLPDIVRRPLVTGDELEALVRGREKYRDLRKAPTLQGTLR